MRYSTEILFLLLFTFTLSVDIGAQSSENEHQLLWKISGNGLEKASYLYGTIHIKDPRVFNFSDSVYTKIEESDFFALEVHPDTIIKHMIINPFISTINKRYDIVTQEKESIMEMVSDSLGIDLSKIKTDEPALVDLFMKQFFDKKKEKRSIVDAHLYYIANVLGKDLLGLETLEDRKIAWGKKSRRFGTRDSTVTPRMLQKSLEEITRIKSIIEYYIQGDINRIADEIPYGLDSSMIYRNHIMVSNAIPIMNKGSLFMAIGVGHLAGRNGVIELLREKGYTVEPVKATFNELHKESKYIDKELPWSKTEYPIEGYSFSTPYVVYEYQPEDYGGLLKIALCADLGKGHYYTTLATPISIVNSSLDELVDMTCEEMRTQNKKLKITDRKDVEVNGMKGIVLECSVGRAGYVKVLYVYENNYFYSLLFITEAANQLKSHEVSQFFDSFKLIPRVGFVDEYIDPLGAFKIKREILPQKYRNIEVDKDSPTLNSETFYTNFFDSENQLYCFIVYTHFNPLTYFSDFESSVANYGNRFIESESDSLVFDSIQMSKMQVKSLIYNKEDESHTYAKFIVRGNRFYQIMMTGELVGDLSSWDEVMNSFEFMNYAEKNWEPYMAKDDSFSAIFPGEVVTSKECIDLQYATNIFPSSKIYAAQDSNSSATFTVEEHDISPYLSFQNRDSLFHFIHERFENYNDSSIQHTVKTQEGLEFCDFTSYNVNSALAIDSRYILTKNKLFRLVVREDQNERDVESKNKFFDNFNWTNSEYQAYSLADTSEVTNYVIRDLSSSDSSTFSMALDNVGFYSYDAEQLNILIDIFNSSDFDDKELLSKIYTELSPVLIKEMGSDKMHIIKEKYLSLPIESEGRRTILASLVETKEKVKILLFKELMNTSPYKPEEEWQYSGVLYSLLDSIELVEYLMPDLLDWSVSDSVMKFEYVIITALENDVIHSKELERINQELTDRIEGLLLKIERKNEDDGEFHMYGLANLIDLSKYLPLVVSHKEAYALLLKDSSVYFKAKGVECYLRHAIDVDTTHIHVLRESHSGKSSLYEMHRQFPHTNLLTNDDFDYEAYAIAYGNAYIEDMEYVEVKGSEFLQTIHKNGYVYFLLRSNYSYYEEELEYIDILIRIANPSNDFNVPATKDVFVDYSYLEDENDKAGQEYLLGLIEKD